MSPLTRQTRQPIFSWAATAPQPRPPSPPHSCRPIRPSQKPAELPPFQQIFFSFGLLHSNRPATILAHRLPRRPKHGRPHRTRRPNSHPHLKSRFTGPIPTPTARSDIGKKWRWARSHCFRSLQRRVNPRAASSSGAWRRRAATVLWSRNLPSSFLYYVIVYLCDVFVCFILNLCFCNYIWIWLYKKNNKKWCVCCVCFFFMHVIEL